MPRHLNDALGYVIFTTTHFLCVFRKKPVRNVSCWLSCWADFVNNLSVYFCLRGLQSPRHIPAFSWLSFSECRIAVVGCHGCAPSHKPFLTMAMLSILEIRSRQQQSSNPLFPTHDLCKWHSVPLINTVKCTHINLWRNIWSLRHAK